MNPQRSLPVSILAVLLRAPVRHAAVDVTEARSVQPCATRWSSIASKTHNVGGWSLALANPAERFGSLTGQPRFGLAARVRFQQLHGFGRGELLQHLQSTPAR